MGHASQEILVGQSFVSSSEISFGRRRNIPNLKVCFSLVSGLVRNKKQRLVVPSITRTGRQAYLEVMSQQIDSVTWVLHGFPSNVNTALEEGGYSPQG